MSLREVFKIAGVWYLIEREKEWGMPGNQQKAYNSIAGKYDVLFSERDEIGIIKKLITKYHPKARNILELACGTAALLQPFKDRFKLSGIDSSPEMIKIAKGKLPKAEFYCKDMTTFKLKEKYDVILCLFNSINHLDTFKGWKSLFKSVSSHLKSNGIFIFDILTIEGLKTTAETRSIIERRKKNILITEYDYLSAGSLQIKFSIFSNIKNNKYLLSESTVTERSYPIRQIKMGLQRYFSNIHILNADNLKPASAGSLVQYFVCKAN